MKLRQAIVERLAYLFFGNNLVIGLHIKKQLEFLKEHIPPSFQHRKMDDLGCGDGKVTIRLKDIFLPMSFRYSSFIVSLLFNAFSTACIFFLV